LRHLNVSHSALISSADFARAILGENFSKLEHLDVRGKISPASAEVYSDNLSKIRVARPTLDLIAEDIKLAKKEPPPTGAAGFIYRYCGKALDESLDVVVQQLIRISGESDCTAAAHLLENRQSFEFYGLKRKPFPNFTPLSFF